MWNGCVWIVTAVVLLQPGIAFSQAVSPAANEPTLRTFFTDVVDDVRRLPSSNAAGLSIAVGSILSTSLHPLDDDLAQWRPEDEFKSGTWIGNPLVLAGSSLALYGIGEMADSRRTKWVASDLFRAQLLSLGICYGIKYAVQRERPDHSSNDSFPSGHSTQMFASAAVLTRHFGVGAAWPAFGTATFVSLSRLNQHRHYLSDVVFGAGLGLAVGWSGATAAADWRITPTLSPTQVSIEVSKVFTP